MLVKSFLCSCFTAKKKASSGKFWLKKISLFSKFWSIKDLQQNSFFLLDYIPILSYRAISRIARYDNSFSRSKIKIIICIYALLLQAWIMIVHFKFPSNGRYAIIVILCKVFVFYHFVQICNMCSVLYYYNRLY